MAYAQQTAKRVQETQISVIGSAWTLLEGTTVLPNRISIKIFNVGSGGATRLGLKYMNSDGTAPTTFTVKQSTHWLGAGQFIVEPASTGLKLYGRAKLASGISSIRVQVTEYSE